MKKFLIEIAAVTTATGFVVGMLALALYVAQPCKRGDPGILIGGAMLVAGCR